MRHFASLLGFAAVVSARCSVVPCAGKCAQAVSQDPEVGASFCSSFLSLAPATRTVTQVDVAESTHTNVETITSTLTLIDSTSTTTLASTITVYQKRQAAGPAETISASCSSNAARLSSACNCFFGSTTSTSTATVTESSTSTSIYEETTTSTEIATVSEVAIATATPSLVIPANPIVNGDFENYITTGNIAPWTDTTATTGGTVQIINGVNPCTATGYCAGGRVVVRVYPPTTGGVNDYTALVETFNARPSTTYTVSFVYRCLNFDASTGIDVYYQGSRAGGITCPAGNSAAFNMASGIQFTTDATGAGQIQIRFLNPNRLLYTYFYADQFTATAVTSN
ncbi:hypothetical protein DL546_005043 [Coniochaeta pulveracea]|uniref:CBM-cenC domain-containing protein n=1 Tax=Coniochaeta pulveracea TaxID=177199 RepID=A0A420Y1J2_9PEZI|nr:hypothetical protein DL546_005043 [Coniochaeta pulveracea]